MKILKLFPALLLLLCASCRAQFTTNPPGHVVAPPGYATNAPVLRWNYWFLTTNAPPRHFTLVTNVVEIFDTNVIVVSGTPGGLYDGQFFLGANYTGLVDYTHGYSVTNATAWYGTNAPNAGKFIYIGPGYTITGAFAGSGFVLDEGNVFGARCNSFGTNLPSAWMPLENTGGCNATYLLVTNSVTVITNYP